MLLWPLTQLCNLQCDLQRGLSAHEFHKRNTLSILLGEETQQTLTSLTGDLQCAGAWRPGKVAGRVPGGDRSSERAGRGPAWLVELQIVKVN